MMISKSAILLSGPEDDFDSEPDMKFRLTYDGALRPTGNDPVGGQTNPLAAHKHDIRKVFHSQLKQFWKTDNFLSEARATLQSNGDLLHVTGDAPWLADTLADQYQEYGYRFVPLVRGEFKLLCSLRILFLRRDPPGSGVIHAGDIDNRIKTLIDALRRPRNAMELVGHNVPADGEDPFFVLMEDDAQVTHLEVETDVLLAPSSANDQRQAHVVVTVELRPYYVTMFNLSFS